MQRENYPGLQEVRPDDPDERASARLHPASEIRVTTDMATRRLRPVDAIMFFVPGKAAKRSAAIDQQSFSTGRNDKQRITLTYIKNRQFQRALCPRLSEGIDRYRQRAGDERHA